MSTSYIGKFIVWGFAIVFALTLPYSSEVCGREVGDYERAFALGDNRVGRRTADNRKIKLQSTRNTRDLGGLPAGNGYIKDRILYRSGALCYTTDEDQETINKLKLRTIIDLRTPDEIMFKEGPDRLIMRNTVRVLNYPMSNKGNGGNGMYYSYLMDNDSTLRGFFATLAKPNNYPILYHCSAGKDRTGVLTALLLELVGTNRSAIMDDYLQSQRNSSKLTVKREWLQGVFDKVDKSGGIVPFLLHHGVPSKHIKAIRDYIVGY